MQNLVVTSLTSSNGTVDYLKYDPEEDSQYHRPSITFNIEDEGDPHQYQCVAMIQPTANAGSEFLNRLYSYGYATAYAWETAGAGNPIPMSMAWDGSTTANAQADSAEWGTYTYDVIVYEFDEDGSVVDSFAYKWPYCLSIANEEHQVWYHESSDKTLELRCNYTLSDYGNGLHLPNAKEPLNISLVPVDGRFNEYTAIKKGGTQLNILQSGTDGNGILALNLPANSEDGAWRVIYTGDDQCWAHYRRDHLFSRMLAVNDTPILYLGGTEQQNVWPQVKNGTTQINANQVGLKFFIPYKGKIRILSKNSAVQIIRITMVNTLGAIKPFEDLVGKSYISVDLPSRGWYWVILKTTSTTINLNYIIATEFIQEGYYTRKPWTGPWWANDVQRTDQWHLYDNNGALDKFSQWAIDRNIFSTSYDASALERSNHYCNHIYDCSLGHCDPYSAASILEPEPPATGITVVLKNNATVHFTQTELKGLLTASYAGYNDIYPAEWGTSHNWYGWPDSVSHNPVKLLNLLQQYILYDPSTTATKSALVVDLSPTIGEFQTWNHPVTGYHAVFATDRTPNCRKIRAELLIFYNQYYSKNTDGSALIQPMSFVPLNMIFNFNDKYETIANKCSIVDFHNVPDQIVVIKQPKADEEGCGLVRLQDIHKLLRGE